MKKLNFPILTLFMFGMFVAGISLWAADVWVAKPYTDWNEKDLQKIMNDSPWVKKVSVEFENTGRGGGGGDAKGVGRVNGPQGGSADPGTDGGGGTGIAESGGGGGRGGGKGGGGGGGGGAPAAVGVPETELTIRWQSAPVIQQALVKAQYGAEAATNADAQKRLQHPDDMYYVIWISGLPAGARPRDDEAKSAMLKVSSLSAKDKDAIAASDVIFDPPNAKQPRVTGAHFLFPRKIAFSADDKEVEFSTRIGKNLVKTKFALKAMMVNGKLGL